MTWPSAQDYVEAVQAPQLAFDDADLKGGTPEVSALGLPQVISGQFACVFKFKAGNRVWAVRCFLRQFPDQQARYAEISALLESEQLPFMTEFKFVEKGIKVRGVWYPILKMEWVQGQLLADFVAGHLSDSALLSRLADELAEIHESLKAREIAHGDLQHGNILVCDGKLRLIDYDAMYVPALKGRGSHEVGHRNFQHPFREEADFDPDVDTFSVWVICISLVLLSLDASLWRTLKGGDDSLLFKGDDFKEPFDSRAFAVLARHQRPEVCRLAQFLESACYAARLQDIKPFEGQLAASTTAGTAAASDLPDWLPEPEGALADSAASPGADWIVDHLEMPTERFGGPPSRAARVMLVVSPLLLLATALGLVAAPMFSVLVVAVSVGGVVVIGLGVVLMFRQDPTIARRMERDLTLRAAIREMRRIERQVREQSKARQSNRTAAEARKRSLRETFDECDEAMTAASTECERELRHLRQDANARRVQVDEAERTELAELTSRFDKELASVASKKAELHRQHDLRISQGLDTFEEEHARTYLRRFSIADAGIPGVGEKLKARLLDAGIETAQEADPARVIAVEGIGQQKAARIAQWRKDLRRGAPSALPSNALGSLEAEYARELAPILRQEADLSSQSEAEVERVKQRAANTRVAIASDLGQLEERARDREAGVLSKCRSQREHVGRTAAVREAEWRKVDDDVAVGLQQCARQLSEQRFQVGVLRKRVATFDSVSFPKWVRYQFTGEERSHR